MYLLIFSTAKPLASTSRNESSNNTSWLFANLYLQQEDFVPNVTAREKELILAVICYPTASGADASPQYDSRCGHLPMALCS